MTAKHWQATLGPAGLVVAALVLLAGALAARACMDYRQRPSRLATEAISANPEKAKAAIAALRAKGPAGLAEVSVLLTDVPGTFGMPAAAPRVSHALDDLESLRESEATRRHHDRDLHRRILAAVDAVAAQKDAAWSGLYWHTDFEAAKAAARREGKPIVSLRLLGRLDEELSCANSRFFRTVLYADEAVGRALRERFVLHWQSVRPVPKVTIDMGDGRVICRTVTGNSIHYVLDADGRPVDALPGLYGPKAFLRGLEEAARAERDLRKVAPDGEARVAALGNWHADRVVAIEAAWSRDLREATGQGGGAPARRQQAPAAQAARGRAVPAIQAAPLAMAKVAVEWNLVRALEPKFTALTATTDDSAWRGIASLPIHRDDARLGARSRAVMRAKHTPAASDALEASRLAVGKRIQEDPVLRMVTHFERSIAEDTVRNEYVVHRRIHEWFVSRLPETIDAQKRGPDALNERVYAELFLTPSSDPWLGLVPHDAYSALEGGGVITQPQTAAR